jgi:SAM-dependent methyltransferase
MSCFCKRVISTGKVYGLDMTDEMLALANQNAGLRRRASNFERRSSLPDTDVIISNCVINLAADKDRVLQEAFRVLKPGGRFAVSDVVTRGEMAPAIRQSVLLWVGCVAGALQENEYREKLAAAGFERIEIEPTRIYRVEDAREFLSSAGLDVDKLAPEVNGRFMSAFVRAHNERGSVCCVLNLLPVISRALSRGGMSECRDTMSCSSARKFGPFDHGQAILNEAGLPSLHIAPGPSSGTVPPKPCVS